MKIEETKLFRTPFQKVENLRTLWANSTKTVEDCIIKMGFIHYLNMM